MKEKMAKSEIGLDMGISRVASNIRKSEVDESKSDSIGKVDGIGNGSVRKKDIDVNRSYNGLSRENLKNLIANIAYNETMQDYIKEYDPSVVYAFMNLLNNRSGGNMDNVSSEIARKGQFSSFKKHVPNGIIVDDGFNQWNPSMEGGVGKATNKLWSSYNDFAEKMLNGEIPNVIGDRNMLANKRIDNKKSLEKWGNDCDMPIGSQMYGYQPDQDGYLKYKTEKPEHLNHDKIFQQQQQNNNQSVTQKKNSTTPSSHVVKKGDTLWGIARKYGKTASELAKNNGIPENGILRPGQTISI